MSDSAIILLGASEAADHVRRTLTDWSGAGLLEPFIWVRPDWTGGAATRGLLIADGLASGSWMEQELAGRVAQVRVGVLVSNMGPSAPDLAQNAAALLRSCRSVRADMRIVPVRCLLARSTSGTPVEISVPGWQNLIVSAEDSRDPRDGIVPLPDAGDPGVAAVAWAGAVAGIFGLWKGLAAGPLDAAAVPPERPARLVRSHVRIADATELVQVLRGQTFDLARVPAVRTPTGPSSPVADIRAATHATADGLLQAHQDKLLSARMDLPTRTEQKVGALTALRRFFSFLAKSLLGAPGEWAKGVVNAVTGRVSNWVQDLVYGQDSSFQVVLAGQLGQLSSEQIGQLTQHLDLELDRYDRRPQEAAADLSNLWQGYADGAMTLIDAGERSSATPPILVGTQRGTVSLVDDVVARVEASFVVNPNVAAVTGVQFLRPEDWLGQQRFANQLAQAGPQLGDDAVRQTQTQLQEWQRNHEHRYSVRVGAQLGGLLQRLAAQIEDLGQRLAAAVNTRLDEAIVAAQRRAATRVRVFTGLLAVAIVILSALAWFEVISVAWLAALGCASVLSWLVAVVVNYLQGQRLFYQWLNRRERAIEEATVNQQNLRAAVRDARRVSDAYRQFLDWTRVLGVFLHQPFGHAGHDDADRPPLLAGLPQSVGLGEVRQHPDDQRRLAAVLRRRLFTAGWLSELWQAELAGVPRVVGPDALDLQTDPQLIFQSPGRHEDAVLTKWADLLEAQGACGAGADRAWQVAVSALEGGGESIFDRAQVKLLRGSAGAEEFFAGLTRPAAGQPFDRRFLTTAAGLAAENQPAMPAWTQSFGSPLGRGVARVEFSQALRPDRFAFVEPESSRRTGPVIDTVM